MRIAVFASGEGTTLDAILAAIRSGSLAARVVLVVVNNVGCGALRLARAEEVPTAYLSRTTHPEPADLDHAIRSALDAAKVDVIVLAGYMRKIGPETLQHYAGRIINTHPSLLPRHGGQGMYGRRVHEAVLSSGDALSGASVHLVDDEYDTGGVVAQATVPVIANETVESLEAKVREREKSLLCEVLQRIASGQLRLVEGR